MSLRFVTRCMSVSPACESGGWVVVGMAAAWAAGDGEAMGEELKVRPAFERRARSTRLE